MGERRGECFQELSVTRWVSLPSRRRRKRFEFDDGWATIPLRHPHSICDDVGNGIISLIVERPLPSSSSFPRRRGGGGGPEAGSARRRDKMFTLLQLSCGFLLGLPLGLCSALAFLLFLALWPHIKREAAEPPRGEGLGDMVRHGSARAIVVAAKASRAFLKMRGRAQRAAARQKAAAAAAAALPPSVTSAAVLRALKSRSKYSPAVAAAKAAAAAVALPPSVGGAPGVTRPGPQDGAGGKQEVDAIDNEAAGPVAPPGSPRPEPVVTEMEGSEDEEEAAAAAAEAAGAGSKGLSDEELANMPGERTGRGGTASIRCRTSRSPYASRPQNRRDNTL